MAEDRNAPADEATASGKSRSGRPGERQYKNSRSHEDEAKKRNHILGSFLDIGEAVIRARTAVFAEVLSVIAESARSISDGDYDHDRLRVAADTLADGISDISHRVDQATEQLRRKS